MGTFTNNFSRLFGKLANYPFSTPLQTVINNGYVKLMGLDMSEFDLPKQYTTLNKLFTRALNKPRVFDMSENVLISPCDSFITQCGDINSFDALQIKGMAYNVEEFITDKISLESRKILENGSYMNFYLSPKDYHRYHVPMDMRVKKVVYVPGKLYPVNIASLEKRLNLFIENERVVLECEARGKTFFMVLVGALNVGKMVVNFEPEIETNTQTREIKVFDYPNTYLKKGDELGYFKMGSTIIMLGEKDLFEYTIQQGDKISFAQSIGTIN